MSASLPFILLVQPPIRDFYLTAKRTVPYGLACIAAALRKNGFAVAIFDALANGKSRILPIPEEMRYLLPHYGRHDMSPFSLFHHYRHYGCDFDEIGRAARASNAFLVGVSSLFSAYGDEALAAACAIKRFHPEAAVVLGGHHPTAVPEAVLCCEAVDFVIRGEGEASLPRLAAALRLGKRLDGIPGLVRRGEEKGSDSPLPAVMADIDAYPPAAHDLIDRSYYRRGKKGSIVVTTSRGCPLNCSYCSVGGAFGLGYRRRSIGAVLEEIRSAASFQEVGFIDFEDENLSLDKSWFLDLLSGILKLFGGSPPELRAMNGLYPPSLDAETIRAMRDAGFKTLNLSLISTSRKCLERFGRADVRESLDHALEAAETLGMDAVSYIIAGAPFQEPEDALSDLLHLAYRNTLAGVSVFYPSPGSADFALCKKHALLPETFSLFRSSAAPISHTTSREESMTLLRLGRVLNFMKSLVRQGIPFPEATPLEAVRPGAVQDRQKAGRMLLGCFFYDGRLRGITREGEIYEHPVSRDLCLKFLDRLKTDRIK